MSEIKIEKVKLIKGGEKLLVQLKEDQEFADAGDMEASVSKTCNNPIHPDLRNAMNGLRCHLGILADYITHKQALNQDEIEKFTVIGYSIGGDEDEQGVVLTGQRKTKSGKMVTLNTPFLRLPKRRSIIQPKFMKVTPVRHYRKKNRNAKGSKPRIIQQVPNLHFNLCAHLSTFHIRI